MSKYIVVGNTSDSSVAIDLARLMGLAIDVSDLVSLKLYSNSEFCPRFIGQNPDTETIGEVLKDTTVVIVSTTSNLIERNSLAMRNMILSRAAKDNGAERVILFEPDLYYSAQDRGPKRYGADEADRDDKDLKKFNGQPFTAKLYAELLKQSGVDTVVTIHNHSYKVQDLFRATFGDDQFHNLIPAEVYSDYIKRSDMLQCGKDGDNLVLCAPDKGAVPFVKMVHEALNLPECKMITLAKERSGERNVSMTVDPSSPTTLEEIKGKDIIVLDDMVRTGTTIVQCCEMLANCETGKVCFGVTHFYTSSEARENLNTPHIHEILTSNSIPTILNRDEQGRLRRKLVVLKVGKWVADYLLNDILGEDDPRYEKDLYSIDMSSQNKRWPPPQGN
tara:strand:- start:2970 stop:4139 length:1170 start_codon:yes stop_codon:yes gene_type:complete